MNAPITNTASKPAAPSSKEVRRVAPKLIAELAPEPSELWAGPAHAATLVFLDLEMTGLDVGTDRVLEICADRFEQGVLVKRLHTLVNPGEMAELNAAVHGINAEMLAGSPLFSDVAEELRALLAGGVLVAHAVPWDLGFLLAEYDRLGAPLAPPHTIDTLLLSRRCFASPAYGLDALCTHFGIARAGSHRANHDVDALREIWAHCLQAVKPESLRELWDICHGERKVRESILQICEAAVLSKKPVTLSYRPSSSPPVQLRFVPLRVDREPPRLVGYEANTRSRLELKPERILAVLDA